MSVHDGTLPKGTFVELGTARDLGNGQYQFDWINASSPTAMVTIPATLDDGAGARARSAPAAVPRPNRA